MFQHDTFAQQKLRDLGLRPDMAKRSDMLEKKVHHPVHHP